MTQETRDPHTGYLTTGHEWNGIEELNTPVPRIVLAFLAITIVFSVVYWVLVPAWPLGTTYTRGLLGIDQRDEVAAALDQGRRQRAAWTQQIATRGFADIQADAGLMAVVRRVGATLYGDNCAVCHGATGAGGPGYPALTGATWLWGGEPEIIAETIRVGINSSHPDTRVSQMLAFGQDQLLSRAEIDSVVAYVRALSDPAAANAAEHAEGRKVYAATCAACHGPAGKGLTEFGAPDLTDGFWIYGGDLESVFHSVWYGRQGQMPAWEGRLGPVERKILALYLLDRRAVAP